MNINDLPLRKRYVPVLPANPVGNHISGAAGHFQFAFILRYSAAYTP